MSTGSCRTPPRRWAPKSDFFHDSAFGEQGWDDAGSGSESGASGRTNTYAASGTPTLSGHGGTVEVSGSDHTASAWSLDHVLDGDGWRITGGSGTGTASGGNFALYDVTETWEGRSSPVVPGESSLSGSTHTEYHLDESWTSTGQYQWDPLFATGGWGQVAVE